MSDRPVLSAMLVDALAKPGPQPETAFAALGLLADEVVGVKLFTLMALDETTRQARRIYSNMPDVYPVLGTKPMNETHWSDIVIRQRRTFVANDIAAIAEVFFDHELIQSLGCASVINVPIVVAGSVIGTVNCLHEAGHYGPRRVADAEALKLPGAACFLLAANLTSQGDA